MANKKKTLTVIGLCSFVIGSASFIFINNGKKILKSFANTPYSCQLPDDYVEIEDVIKYAITYAGEEPVENPYTFRGTVSRRFGDMCFLQRVNQKSYYLDAIKIKGLNMYASEVSEGCVLDISGGTLSFDYNTLTLTLTNNSQHVVSYNQNPYGCDPKVFASFEDAGENMFDCVDPDHDLYYGTSRYVQIKDVSVVLAEESQQLTLGTENYYYGALNNPNNDDQGFYFAFTSDYESISNKVNEAMMNNLLMHARGITYYRDNYLVVLLQSADDLEISETSSIDTTLITKRMNSEMRWGTTDNSRINFTLYNVVGKENIPYVEIGQLINYSHALFGDYNTKYMRKYLDSSDNNVVYYSNNTYGYYEINAEDNYIASVSFIGQLDGNTARTEQGYRYLNDYYGEYCVIDEELCKHHSSHKFDDETNKSFKPVVFYDLDAYGFDIVVDKFHNFYAPLNPMIDIMMTNDAINFAYNGKDIYLSNALSISGVLDMFYSTSPFVGEETRSQMYAEYTYNALCFSLKHCYGLLERRDATNVDYLFESLGVKEGLLSTNCVEYEEAMAEFAGKWLYEGHARYMFDSPFANDYQNQEDENNNRFANIYRSHCLSNNRYNQLWDTHDELTAQREAAEKNVGLSTYEDTAIITFDQFVKYRKEYTYEEFNEMIDTYSYEQLHGIGTELLFAKAFKEISENDDVKNVVFDMTLNGGGEIAVVPYLVAYMTPHPSCVMNYRLDEEVEEIVFKVDLNSDGVFDENDTCAGKYNFYCMNSRFSFSCGNFFPTVLKTSHLATLIGERSGGGICAVGAISTACGTVLRNSSNYQLGYYDIENECFGAFEDGAEADYPFARANFYNDEAIYNFIHSLSA